MTSEQPTERTFNSIEEIISQYLPESARKEKTESVIDPNYLGVILARTKIKNVKTLLERNY